MYNVFPHSPPLTTNRYRNHHHCYQVSLALRIRVEKMEDSLRTVGLSREAFEELLRDKEDGGIGGGGGGGGGRKAVKQVQW